MWIPNSTEEIEAAVNAGTLRETYTFDAKRELGTKSKDIAKDIAAMANDGGVLIYGIGEDDQKRPRILAPFDLTHQRERINNIAQTCIAEHLTISSTPIPSSADPSLGYLVVEVPASPRAPHMVICDKDNRYYRRTDVDSVPMSEGDVERLYQRRALWSANADSYMDELIGRSPLAPHQDFSYLHLLARPLLSDNSLLSSAQKGQTEKVVLNDLLREAVSDKVYPWQKAYPDFSYNTVWHRRAHGWVCILGKELSELVGTDQKDSRNQYLDLFVNLNGSASLFAGGAAVRNRSGTLILDEILITALVSRFIALVGDLYSRAQYRAPVDLSIAVTGLSGARTSTIYNRMWPHIGFPEYDRSEYRSSLRVLAPSVLTNPTEIVERLILTLTDAVTESNFKPFPQSE